MQLWNQWNEIEKAYQYETHQNISISIAYVKEKSGEEISAQWK